MSIFDLSEEVVFVIVSFLSPKWRRLSFPLVCRQFGEWFGYVQKVQKNQCSELESVLTLLEEKKQLVKRAAMRGDCLMCASGLAGCEDVPCYDCGDDYCPVTHLACTIKPCTICERPTCPIEQWTCDICDRVFCHGCSYNTGYKHVCSNITSGLCIRSYTKDRYNIKFPQICEFCHINEWDMCTMCTAGNIANPSDYCQHYHNRFPQYDPDCQNRFTMSQWEKKLELARERARQRKVIEREREEDERLYLKYIADEKYLDSECESPTLTVTNRSQFLRHHYRCSHRGRRSRGFRKRLMT